MSAVPPGFSTLRLPLGNIVQYPTGHPSIRVLAREIEALGYVVSVFPLPHPDLRSLLRSLRSLTPGVWHNSVIIDDIIIFITTPTAPSVFSGSSASDLSAYESPNNASDSDNFDPPSSDPPSSSDQSGYGSSDHNEPDSDNVDPDFPEDGYWRA